VDPRRCPSSPQHLLIAAYILERSDHGGGGNDMEFAVIVSLFRRREAMQLVM
jgi:hypothetical protein